MADYVDLKGNTIVITGSFGNLGRAFCSYVKHLQPRLIMLDQGTSVSNEFVESLESCGAKVEVFPLDLENRSERKRIFEEISRACESVDVLINNAAFVGSSELAGWNTNFGEQSLETWDRALNVNLSAPFELIQYLHKKLNESDKASVVNIGSIYGEFGPDWSLYENTGMGNPAAYSASKGGLLQITRWLATTLSPSIRVNAISPGGIQNNQPQIFLDRYISKTPLKRMATVQDIVPAVAFLASTDSKYITGQNLRVDGGWSIW